MNPPRSILNRSFKYRDSAHTDVAATFARIRREQREQEAARAEQAKKVSPMRTRSGSISAPETCMYCGATAKRIESTYGPIREMT